LTASPVEKAAGFSRPRGEYFMASERLRVLKERLIGWFKKYSIYLSILVLTILFFAILLSNRIVYNIHAGERGVRWSRFTGTVTDRVYNEGIRLIPPYDEMYIYNVRVQELHDSIVVLSSNGLPMTVSYSSRYHADVNRVPLLHQKYGPDYAELFVRPEIVSAFRAVLGNYRPEEIYAMDEQGLLDEIYTVLEANVADHYVVLEDVLIKELRLTPELEAAINQKLVQEQNALAYEFRLKTEESEKQRKAIEAEGISDFTRISGIDILKWRGLEVTSELAKSPNSKIIIMGSGNGQLPIILGADK